jgi:hypothetical protein
MAGCALVTFDDLAHRLKWVPVDFHVRMSQSKGICVEHRAPKPR